MLGPSAATEYPVMSGALQSKKPIRSPTGYSGGVLSVKRSTTVGGEETGTGQPIQGRSDKGFSYKLWMSQILRACSCVSLETKDRSSLLISLLIETVEGSVFRGTCFHHTPGTLGWSRHHSSQRLAETKTTCRTPR